MANLRSRPQAELESSEAVRPCRLAKLALRITILPFGEVRNREPKAAGVLRVKVVRVRVDRMKAVPQRTVDGPGM
jgi:hypothetical protein